MKFKNDFGRSMLEMLLYITLMIVLSTAGISMYGDAVDKAKITDLESQIQDLTEIVNTYYLGRSFTNNSDVSTTLKNNANANLKNPWSNAITIKTFTAVTGLEKPNKQAFVLNFTTTSQKECGNVLVSLIHKGAVGVKVGSGNLSKVIDGNIPNLSCSFGSSEASKVVAGYFYKN